MSASALVIGTVVVFTCFCAVVDLRTRRIPNALTGAALITGLSINFILFGFTGLLNSLSGLVILTAVLFTPFALGGIGGGDVKMMAAVGALLGPRLGLASLCAGVIIGGVVMAAHLLRQGQLVATLARIKNMLVAAIGAGSVEPLRVSSMTSNAIALPYSVPLGLGTLLVAWIGL